MYNIGDLVIYSSHGLSRIDDICEKTISNVTKMYYVLHPLDQANLIINVPVDKEKVLIQKTMDSTEAKRVLESFKQPDDSWVENSKLRYRQYQEMIKSGDRNQLAKVANILMRKDLEMQLDNKKLADQDRKMLEPIQNILFKQFALALDTTFEKITEQVNSLIKFK